MTNDIYLFPTKPNPNDIGLRSGPSGGGVAHSIVGAVLVTIAVAATMDVTRHEAIVGSVTTTATPASAMDLTRHRALAGNVTVTITPAATLDITRHHGLAGAVTTTAVPNAALDFTRHASLVGAVTVASTPVASLMDFTRHASLVGAVQVSATPAATLDFTRHATLAGAVTVFAVPAAAMAYTPASGGAAHSLVGAVTVAAVPAAAMHYTAAPPRSIAWAPPHPPTRERPSDHRALVGNVTVEIALQATMARHLAPRLSAPAVVPVTVPIAAAPPMVLSRPVVRHASPEPARVAVAPPAPAPAAQHRELVGSVVLQGIPAATMHYAPAPPRESAPWSLDADEADMEDILLLVGAFR